ncbi:hypothetical protein HPP92_025577 [Vanilla planifolia]|uniref:Uncharacterized protein n=1 Tax=Vanilla planifolia TaxID=51239 RepID=A0A835PKE2_VANPL|nr:hypothetical protein HPP92_025577 [Vanilla planifolia]
MPGCPRQDAANGTCRKENKERLALAFHGGRSQGGGFSFCLNDDDDDDDDDNEDDDESGWLLHGWGNRLDRTAGPMMCTDWFRVGSVLGKTCGSN